MIGKLITLEGIDGAGRNIYLVRFAQQLQAELALLGKKVIVTREPDGTLLGEYLYEVLPHERMHLKTEVLLTFADRYEHVAEVIQPALGTGDWIISGRFIDATFVCQGGGKGLATNRLEVLGRWVQQGPQPTGTILFDLVPETAAAHLADACALDKSEAESAQFFLCTRAKYLRRTAIEPDRFVMLSANRERADIQEDLESLLAAL